MIDNINRFPAVLRAAGCPGLCLNGAGKRDGFGDWIVAHQPHDLEVSQLPIESGQMQKLQVIVMDLEAENGVCRRPLFQQRLSIGVHRVRPKARREHEHRLVEIEVLGRPAQKSRLPQQSGKEVAAGSRRRSDHVEMLHRIG